MTLRASFFMILALAASVAGVSAETTDQCVQLGAPIMSSCQAELADLNKVYPVTSEQPITDAQLQQVLGVAAATNLPSPQCCQDAQRFSEARCACDPALPNHLAAVGVKYSLPGLQSADKVVSEACKFKPLQC